MPNDNNMSGPPAKPDGNDMNMYILLCLNFIRKLFPLSITAHTTREQ